MNKSKITSAQLEQMKELFLNNKEKFFSGNYLQDLLTLNKMGVQLGIRALRLEGQPIIARGSMGYAYTDDQQEILATSISLRNRGKKVIESGESMLKTFLKRQGDKEKLPKGVYGVSGIVNGEITHIQYYEE